MTKKCAPSKIFEDGSCIDLEDLKELALAYNKEYPDEQIKLNHNLDTLNPKKYKKFLASELNTRLKSVCKDQKCWLKQKFIKRLKGSTKKRLEQDTFRPEGPEGKFEWLSTVDIDNVMRQYHSAHPDFEFIGVAPIDFDDLPFLGFKNLDFKKLVNEGKHKIGAIFNLDEHNKSGSHWVSMFANLKEGKVYFFDSVGYKPEKRIRKFMRRIANFSKKEFGVKVDARYNEKKHQFKNTECGVYSIYFLIHMLKGKGFESHIADIKKDDVINTFRKEIFANVN